jgi:threonine/homoserine/homoserine lactone efflux protein
MIMTDWWYAAITIFVVMVMPGPAMLVGLAVFPQFIDAGTSIVPQVGLLYVTFCACWLVAFMSYATLGALPGGYVRNSPATRWLNLLSTTVYFMAAGMLGARR